MPTVETVELRPSGTESKLKKTVKFLRVCISVVNVLSLLCKAVNYLWNNIGGAVKVIVEIFS